MNRWLRAMNPLMTPRAMAEAQWAGQSLIFAYIISFVGSLPLSIWMIQNPSAVIDLMMAQQSSSGLSDADLATMRPMFDLIVPASFIVGLVTTPIIYGVLGWVQWRYVTRWIPVVWVVLAVYGWGMLLIQTFGGQSPLAHLGPVWMIGVTQAASVLATIIAMAAAQGAIILHRLRQQP